jgi:hypothetical protein
VQAFAKVPVGSVCNSSTEKIHWDGNVWSCQADFGVTDTVPTVQAFAKVPIGSACNTNTEMLHWNGSALSCLRLNDNVNQSAQIMALELSFAALKKLRSNAIALVAILLVCLICLNLCILLCMFKQKRLQKHVSGHSSDLTDGLEPETSRREADQQLLLAPIRTHPTTATQLVAKAHLTHNQIAAVFRTADENSSGTLGTLTLAPLHCRSYTCY